MATRRAASLLVLAVLIGGCTAASPPPSPTPSASATRAGSPTASPVPCACPTPPPGVTPSATATASATASPAPVPTARPTASPAPSAAFACSLPIALPSSAYDITLLTVRVGGHPGYDRVVWEFGGTVLPDVTVTTVQPPFAFDGSGLPFTVQGSSFVKVLIVGAATAYDGPQDLATGLPMVREVRMQGHFEGRSSWIVGLAATTCLRVFTLSGPTRLAVDFQAP